MPTMLCENDTPHAAFDLIMKGVLASRFVLAVKESVTGNTSRWERPPSGRASSSSSWCISVLLRTGIVASTESNQGRAELAKDSNKGGRARLAFGCLVLWTIQSDAL